jgi:hypothetical protein
MDMVRSKVVVRHRIVRAQGVFNLNEQADFAALLFKSLIAQPESIRPQFELHRLVLESVAVSCPAATRARAYELS